ncbi:hypothetical protein ZWY2020_034817 [Hordeum vulgare]|nr:hypothetical protein ZWY2020_034817 [Hordeum vulgare]
MGLLHRNVSFVSKKISQDVEEGSSGEDSDAGTPKTKKKHAKHGRKKATIDTSDGHGKEGKSDTEDASLEEPKIVKMRGRKKAATIASCVEEADKPKEPKKRGRRKVKTDEQLSDDEGEDQSKDLMPSNEMELHSSANGLETKYSFIHSGRPANRMVDRETHSRMKDMFWSLDEFVRAPGGSSSNVSLALAALGGRVVFMGKLGDDEYGQIASTIVPVLVSYLLFEVELQPYGANDTLGVTHEFVLNPPEWVDMDKALHRLDRRRQRKIKDSDKYHSSATRLSKQLMKASLLWRRHQLEKVDELDHDMTLADAQVRSAYMLKPRHPIHQFSPTDFDNRGNPKVVVQSSLMASLDDEAEEQEEEEEDPAARRKKITTRRDDRNTCGRH